MRILNFPLEKTKWCNVKMLKNAEGGVQKIHLMQFKKDEIYRVDEDLYGIFLKYKWAVRARDLPKDGPWILQVKTHLSAKPNKWIKEAERKVINE
jgi:hypothetical protein